MAVDKRHPDYEKREPDWTLVSDFIAGERAVKERGETYLPKLSGHDRDQYAAYQRRAPFFGATRRTREGLAGAIFRKAPIIEKPGRLDAFCQNVDRGGMTIEAFSHFLVNEVIAQGRYGILVDTPPKGGDPYFAGYGALSIVNWRVESIDGEPVTRLVVLREHVETAKPDDEFDTGRAVRYRVLRLDDQGYSQQVYQKGERADVWVAMGEPIYPTMPGNRRINRIPFFVAGPSEIGFTDNPPPLLDVANMNKAHYTLSADWRHGLHYTGLPTPWVASESVKKGETLALGAETAWILGEGGSAGMLEFTGQGLGAVEKALDRTERLMAVLGARLLEDQKVGAEAAATVRMRHSGENSVLASIADTCSIVLTNALELARDFITNATGEVSVTLNTDFFDVPMTAEELTSLVSAWTAGAIPRSVLWHNMREGERIPEDMDDAALIEEIEREGPPGMNGIGEAEDVGQE